MVPQPAIAGHCSQDHHASADGISEQAPRPERGRDSDLASPSTADNACGPGSSSPQISASITPVHSSCAAPKKAQGHRVVPTRKDRRLRASPVKLASARSRDQSTSKIRDQGPVTRQHSRPTSGRLHKASTPVSMGQQLVEKESRTGTRRQHRRLIPATVQLEGASTPVSKQPVAIPEERGSVPGWMQQDSKTTLYDNKARQLQVDRPQSSVNDTLEKKLYKTHGKTATESS